MRHGRGAMRLGSMKRVGVVIINWNGRDYLLRCVDSFLRSRRGDFDLRVFVVDNGSTDGSIESLRMFQDHISVIKLDRNMGACVARNIGIQAARDCDYIVVADNDTIVHEHMLYEMLRTMELDGQVDAVIPLMLEYNSYPQIEKSRGSVVSQIGICGELVPTPMLSQRVHEVNYIHGPMFMLRKSSLHMLDELFDANFFIYYEDLDFSIRFVQRGLRAVICPSAFFWHKAQGSLGHSFHFLASLNKYRSFNKNFSRGVFARFLPLLVLGDILILLSMYSYNFIELISAFAQRMRGYIAGARMERGSSYTPSLQMQRRAIKSMLEKTAISTGRAWAAVRLFLPLIRVYLRV
jgi:GT2 family glycosyltransferase